MVVLVIVLAAVLLWYSGKPVTVEKVVDGDTIELKDGTRIRLAGINTPEKNEPCYWQARLALETLVGGREIKVRMLGTDKYGRALGEVFVGSENINRKMLELGLANRYYGDKIDWTEYSRAEKEGRAAGGCIWEKDELYACVKVERHNTGFVVSNGCNVTIDTPVTVKDTSASHRFSRVLHIQPYGTVTITEECSGGNGTIALCQNIFNYDGDEIFIISGKSGKLIGWAAYGAYEG